MLIAALYCVSVCSLVGFFRLSMKELRDANRHKVLMRELRADPVSWGAE